LRVLLTILAATLALAAPASAQSPSLVINEIDYDQPSDDTAEFLEMRNNAAAAVDLDPYALRFVNGANGSTYGTVDLPAVELAADDRYVVCATPANVPSCDLDAGGDGLIQNGAPDAVPSSTATRSSTGVLRGGGRRLHRGVGRGAGRHRGRRAKHQPRATPTRTRPTSGSRPSRGQG
jgi:hypothetical protein